MSSTYTSNLAIQLMGTGDQSGAWGATTNSNLQYLEEGITGYLSYAVTASNAVTLQLGQASDPSPSARNMIVNLTNGGASTAVTMTVPGTASKLYFIWNQTGQQVTVQGSTPTSNTVVLPSGAQTVVFCDGANNIYPALGALSLTSLTVSTLTASTSISGGTVSGTTITASTQFSGPGTGLTGTASGLSIGGNAATATTATTATSATTATTATNVSGGTATLTGTSTTNTYNIGYLEVPQNANPTLTTDTYATVASDSGKHIYYSGSSTFSSTSGASTASTVSITSVASSGGGTRTQFNFTTPGFTFATGAVVTLTSMTNTAYNGTYTVFSATSTSVVLTVAYQGSTSVTGTLNYCLITIGGTVTGTLYQYQGLSGTGYSNGTYISARQSGTGGAGTYHIYPLQTVTTTTVLGGPIISVTTGIYNTGTVLTIVNDGSTAAPLSIYSTDTVFGAGTGYVNTSGVHVLSQYGQVTLLKVGSTRWQLSGAGVV